MYRQIYEEVAQETSKRIREDEIRAFEHCLSLLKKAKVAGPNTRESVEALFFLSRLWGVLLEDLASPQNGLPEELRAKLISIGIWLLRQAEDIRQGLKADFQPIIDVSRTIYAGLKVEHAHSP